MRKRVYLKNGPDLWMGWRDKNGWQDAANASGSGDIHRTNPLEWAPSLPEFTVPLPEEVDGAGRQLERAVDEAALPVLGAMWTHSPNQGAIFARVAPDGSMKGYPRPRGWRYLLVTPDVGMVRDKLPEIFRSGKISQSMVIDDVDIVGPDDPMFILLEYWSGTSGRSKTEFVGSQHVQTLVRDGALIFCEMRCNAVIYRSLKTG